MDSTKTQTVFKCRRVSKRIATHHLMDEINLKGAHHFHSEAISLIALSTLLTQIQNDKFRTVFMPHATYELQKNPTLFIHSSYKKVVSSHIL